MNRLLTILLLAAGTAYGQIDNPPTSVNIVDSTATGRAVLTATNAAAAATAIGLGATNSVVFGSVTLDNIFTTSDLALELNEMSFEGAPVFTFSPGATESWNPISWTGTNAVANIGQTRTNLGLRLPALTNTSNVTAMRALAGSTNTNQPFSGSISVVGTNNTNTLVFSNGILLSQ
jgi:hypothetical protein